MNERMKQALALRKEVKTFKAIGLALGISASRARELVNEAEWLTRNGRVPPDWASDLDPRIFNALRSAGFTSQQSIVDGLKTGDLRKIPGIGATSISILCEYFNLDQPSDVLSRAIKVVQAHGYVVTKAKQKQSVVRCACQDA